MRLSPAEVRFAWGLLIALAILTYPAPPLPGRFTLAAAALVFLPGTIALATATGSSRVLEGLQRLLSDSVGRLHLTLGLAVAISAGLIFHPFIATALVAGFCGLLWVWDVVRGSQAWERKFANWTLTATVTLVLWGAVEGLLRWPSIARRLGTPAETGRWNPRAYYDGLERNNFFQFRSPYEDTRRKPGVRRIIALGDSFTWGSHIPSSDSTWPALMEDVLARTPNLLTTEVINMGHGGWATGNEAELLRRIGWQFEPDLVIVQWLDNDFYATLPNFWLVDPGKDMITLVPEIFRTGYIRDSGVLALAERVLTSWFISDLELTRSRSAPGSLGWLDVQRALREMSDSATRRCTPILLVLYPYLFPGRWTAETHPEASLHRRMEETARNVGYEVLDLLPTFAAAGKDGKEWWSTPYDSHPSAAGQLLTATTIANYVTENRLLDDSLPRTDWCGG